MKNSNEPFAKSSFSEEHETHLKLVKTARHINKNLEARLKKFELDLPLYNILRIIHVRSDKFVNIKEIQQGMMQKMANTSRLIRVLEDRDLIERKPSKEDKRVVNVNLTEKGIFVMDELDELTNDFYVSEFSDFSKNELKVFSELLSKLQQE